MPKKPRSVCVLNDWLFLADTEGYVDKVDVALTKRQTVNTVYAGEVFRVAALMNSTIMIAGKNGLFQISSTGQCQLNFDLWKTWTYAHTRLNE